MTLVAAVLAAVIALGAALDFTCYADELSVTEAATVAVELKSRAESDAARLTLAEVALCVPARTKVISCDEAMAIDVAEAPAPGKTGRVSRATVEEILTAEFPEASIEVLGADMSFVTARGLNLNDNTLLEPFRAQVNELFSRLDDVRVEVTSIRIESRAKVRPGPVRCSFTQLDFIQKRLDEPATNSIQHSIRSDLESLLTRVQNGARFNAKCVQGGGDPGVFVNFTPRFSVERQLPVARHDLPAKTAFKVADASLTWVPWSRSTFNAVHDASTVSGMQVVRAIRAGQPLMLRDFERPIAVRRGDQVRLIQKAGSLTITGSAVAVSQGAIGENIDVRTVATKKRIRGVIKASGLVEAM